MCCVRVLLVQYFGVGCVPPLKKSDRRCEENSVLLGQEGDHVLKENR